MSRRSYSEMQQLSSFEDRFDYLSLNGKVANETFGQDRYLNQILYGSSVWKSIRDDIIIRDDGCDLGVKDRPIRGMIIVHHIDPITPEDILNGNPKVYDPDNLICSAVKTHKAIHYGDRDHLPKDPVIRTRNDTCPWKQ